MLNFEFLIKSLEVRDVYTRGHTERGVHYAMQIAMAMGLTEKELHGLYIGGLIHDIGKIGIPDVILLKPAKLTKEEFEIMKLHVKIGYELIKDNEIPPECLDVLLYHQEKYDGSGYPIGKKGNDIPILARVYTVADSFEAMTARRIYKKSKTWEEAFQELEELAGKHFDPDIVPYAIKVLSNLKSVPWHTNFTSQDVEKIRWSFYFIDSTGAIKGDLFLPTLNAFIEQREEFCLTVFDIKNLSKINLEKGWTKGNEALALLVRAINMECCSMHDLKDTIVKLMKEDVLDIDSPLIFRIGGDEFAVIAPFIPPPEKVKHVVAFMKEQGVEVSYLQNNYPRDFKSAKEILEMIMRFSRRRAFTLELDLLFSE